MDHLMSMIKKMMITVEQKIIIKTVTNIELFDKLEVTQNPG